MRLVDHVRRAAHLEVSSSRRLEGGFAGPDYTRLLTACRMKIHTSLYLGRERESRSCRVLLPHLEGVRANVHAACPPCHLHHEHDGNWERMQQQPHANPHRAIAAICTRRKTAEFGCPRRSIANSDQPSQALVSCRLIQGSREKGYVSL